MKDTSLKGRLATFGLIAVLFVFTGSSICATIIVRGTSQQASEAVRMSNLYQQAHYLVSSEGSMMYRYSLQPSFDAQDAFRVEAQTLNDVLNTIAQDGDGGDRTFVQSVSVKQAQYVHLANEFFALIDQHSLSDALAYHNGRIAPLFDPMEKQIVTEADMDQQIATQSLNHVDIIQRLVIIFTVFVFVIGLILILIFWRVIRGYQQQLHRITQEELLHMEQVALNDPLTGLPNHRTMMDRIEEELARCQRTRESCAVVFIDLDHFKHINDTWGHRAGDAVLREASSRLKKNARGGDVVGRYGGEEFVMMLSNTNIEGARQAVEQFRIALAEKPCILEPCEDTPAGTGIAFTASIGVAVYGEHGTTHEALIEAADRAMYYAKQTGRNRVCLAGEETVLPSHALRSMSQGQFAETHAKVELQDREALSI